MKVAKIKVKGLLLLFLQCLPCHGEREREREREGERESEREKVSKTSNIGPVCPASQQIEFLLPDISPSPTSLQ